MRGAADRRLLVRHGLAAFLAALIATILMIGITPLHVRLNFAAGGNAPGLTINGTPRPGVITGQPTLGSATVEVIAGPVEFIPPRLLRGPYVPMQDFKAEGAWTHDGGWPPRIRATDPGARIALSGWYADREFVFTRGPGQGKVRIEAGGVAVEHDLSGPTAGSLIVPVPSPERLKFASTPFRWRPARLHIASAESPVQLEVRIAAFTVVERAIAANQTTAFEIPIGDILAALVPGLVEAGLLALKAFAGLAGAFLLGYGPVRMSGLVLSSGEKVLLQVTTGLAGFSILAASIAWVLPAKFAAIIAAILLLITALWALARFPLPARRHFNPHSRLPALVTAASAMAAVTGFWPMVLSGGWFVGLLQTDVYEYGALAELFRDTSVNAAELPFGRGLRYADMIPAAALLALFGGPGIAIFQLVAMIATAGLGLNGACLARRMGASAAMITLAGVVAAFSGSVLGLYVEGYLTRFVFTILAAHASFAAVLALDGPVQSSIGATARGWLPFVLIAAFAVAIVPYYAFFLPAAALALFWRERRQASRALALTVGLVGATILVANVTLWFLAFPKVAFEYSAGADALARHTVFPFFNEPRFATMVLGLSAKHWDAGVAASLVREFSAGGWIAVHYARLLVVLHMHWQVLLLAAIAAAWGAGIRTIGIAKDSRVLFLLLFAAAGVAAAVSLAARDSHLYARLNLLWSLGALFSLIWLPTVLAGVPRPPRYGWTPRRLAHGACVGFAGLWIVLNGGTRVADAVAYYADAHSSATEGHVRIVPDLQTVAMALNRRADEATLVIAGNYGAIRGTDTDRVLINAISSIYRSRQMKCDNCETGGSATSVVNIKSLSRCDIDERSSLIIVGSTPDMCPFMTENRIKKDFIYVGK